MADEESKPARAGRFKNKEFFVDMHPQRQRIIDLIFAGKPMRYISSVISPGIGVMALQRYKSLVLKPMMERAEESRKILAAERAVAASARLKEDPAAIRAEAVVAVKNAIHDREILTIRDNRVKAQQDRHRRLNMIVEGRAKEMAGEAPGAESGFLAKEYKRLGDESVAVYRFDAPLAQSFLDHEKQIAIEMGQWQEQAPPNMSIQIVCPSTSGDPDQRPRVSYSSQDQIDDDVIDIGLNQIS